MKKGFTLVEMLVVIAVVAILASLVLVSLRNVRPSAYDARRIADLQKVQTYLETFYNQNRAYPVVSMWSGLESALMSAINVPGIPNDPLFQSTGATYAYCYNTVDYQSYILATNLSTVENSTKKEQFAINDLGNYTCTQSLDCSPTSPTLCMKN